MPRYIVSGLRAVNGAEPGEPVEIDPADEATLLASGRVKVEPSIYRVIGPHEVHGAKNGETFEAALTAGQEGSLVDTGHVEIVLADASGLEELSRGDLNALAEDAGVPTPGRLPNKEAVIGALRSDTPPDEDKE